MIINLAVALLTSRTHLPAHAKNVPKPPAAVASRGPALCSLNVSDFELAKILQLLSDQSKVNLILLSAPGTKLTFRMNDVPLDVMLHHICALTGLASLNVKGTYVLATDEQLKKGYPDEYAKANPAPPTPPVEPAAKIDEPEIITRSVRLNYVSSVQAVEVIESLFDIKAGTPGKLTVIAGPASSNPSVIDKDTSSATGASGGVITSEKVADSKARGKTVFLRGPKALVDSAAETLEKMDQPRPQVSISVTIHDISNDALKELGLSWSYSDIKINEQDPNKLNFGSFTRAPLSFAATIKALETKNDAKLLASPSISVIDGERAFILIGDRLNFPVLVGYTNANSPIFDKQEERVGIYMQVAPSISSDGNITLSLYPQVSTVSGFLNINGASYPQISTREAQTTLRVKSGETIVMGGLLKDEDIKELERVPFLSRIPILGELFTRRKKSHSVSQVIITITPILIDPKG